MVSSIYLPRRGHSPVEDICVLELKSSEMLTPSSSASDSTTFLRLLHPGDEGTTTLRNGGNSLAVDTA